MQKNSRCAVIGAGFSGLAICKALLDRFSEIEVTLYDPNGYGGEASKISTGLLHKYVGLHSKLNPFGIEGEKTTKQWILDAEQILNRSLILSKGILRLAVTPTQEVSYKKAAELYPDTKWIEPDQVIAFGEKIARFPAIFIESGCTIDVSGYLDGIFTLCENKGLKLQKEQITSLEQLEDYDFCFLATGADPLFSSMLPQLSLVKGQLLEIEWPDHISKPSCSIMGQVYLATSQDGMKAIVGATYEHDFSDSQPKSDFAIKELLPKLKMFYPDLARAKITNIRAGIRASTPSRLPYAKKLKNNLYALCGMGSRGLLYHAYFAKQLVETL